jgi:histidine ammonia-lyase
MDILTIMLNATLYPATPQDGIVGDLAYVVDS